MADTEQEVTNPLVDEPIVLREFVNEVAGSARLDVLCTLDQQQMTPSDVDYRGPVTRQTASNYLTELSELGLTRPADEDGGYELTAGGKVVLDAVVSCLKEVERDSLTSLTQSSHGFTILKRLSESPARPVELAGEGPDLPSRATVQRLLGRFESKNWIKKVESQYQITSNGSSVLEAHDDLVAVIEQVMQKAPWFQRLDSRFADVPVRELGDSELRVSSPENPGVFLATALELCNPELERLRYLTPVFNETLFQAYERLYVLGLMGEGIVDKALYDRLIEDEKDDFLDGSEHPGFDFYRLEESITLGVAIYDENKVVVGGYNEIGESRHIALILSENHALVEWGSHIFDTFRQRAVPALDSSSDVRRD